MPQNDPDLTLSKPSDFSVLDKIYKVNKISVSERFLQTLNVAEEAKND